MINFGITERKTTVLELRMQKCGLLEKDIEEAFVRSSGAGGQKVNKTSSCVHLKHVTSGLEIERRHVRQRQLAADGLPRAAGDAVVQERHGQVHHACAGELGGEPTAVVEAADERRLDVLRGEHGEDLVAVEVIHWKSKGTRCGGTG